MSEEKEDGKFQVPDDFMSAIRGKPRIPNKDEFAAPGETQVVDQETGVPLLNRPKLNSWPLGPFRLDLPPHQNLDPRALFAHAYSSPTLSIETKEMSAAMVAWMASSMSFAQLAEAHNTMIGAFQELWQSHQSLQADYQGLLMQLSKKGIIDITIEEGVMEGDPWQEGPDGSLWARYGSAMAQIRRVLYADVNGHKAVVDAPEGTPVEGTRDGYQLLINGASQGIFDDLESAKAFSPDQGEDEGGDGDGDGDEPTDAEKVAGSWHGRPEDGDGDGGEKDIAEALIAGAQARAEDDAAVAAAQDGDDDDDDGDDDDGDERTDE